MTKKHEPTCTGRTPACLLNFGSCFSAALLLSEGQAALSSRKCRPLLPLRGGRWNNMNNVSPSLPAFQFYNINFHVILFEILIHFNFITLMGCFDSGWERLACGSPASLPAWCSLCAGPSNPISAADPGPRDLMCLYQTSFMLFPVREQTVSWGAKINLVYKSLMRWSQGRSTFSQSQDTWTCSLIFNTTMSF